MASPGVGVELFCKFDEASGTTTADASGHGLTGTLTGTEGWTTGQVGGAFGFDETSHFSFGTSSALKLTTSGTIAAWVNPDDLGGGSVGRIFDRSAAGDFGYSFHLISDGDNKLALANEISPETVTSTGTISFAAWQHVAVTWQGTAIAFYIDGAAAGTATMGGGIASASVAALAGQSNAGGEGFDGEIDELGVWNRALTAAEINIIYTQGTHGKGYTRHWHDFW